MTRTVLAAVLSAFLILFGAVGAVTPAHASLTAGKAFSNLKGTTTIDKGGSFHSQTRSIYSLGGGMATFPGKKVTFLAADPPSFSAGCSGISWHFGGFSFITMDELRQLVEAVSQASLGVAVDLAMQTLCPQCYAVMSKLRDMANMMRNAAADACRVATNMGQMLASSLGLPENKQTDCATGTSAEGKSDGFLNSIGGSLCQNMDKVTSYLTDNSEKILNFLNGDMSAGDKTPPKEVLDRYFNVQYEMLSALGYQDGPIKDMLLNFMGMTIYHPTPAASCSGVFSNLNTSYNSTTDQPTDDKEISSATDESKSKEATSEASGTTKGLHVCHAPPRIEGVSYVGQALVCGFDRDKDVANFLANTEMAKEDLMDSALAQLCRLGKEVNGDATGDLGNIVMYTCKGSETARCTEVKEAKFADVMGVGNDNDKRYTGLAWEVADALYNGVNAVKKNTTLPDNTIAILNGSGYPLYRLINLAAVYPAMATSLIDTYAAVIATQYVIDTLDALARPGSLSSLDVNGINPNIQVSDLMAARASIIDMFSTGGQFKDRTLTLLSQKQALVASIVEINRALQSEVISKGLAGNANLAVSLKNQVNRNPINP